jgi:hypothetical protein
LETKTPHGRREERKHKKDKELTNLDVLVWEGGGTRGRRQQIKAVARRNLSLISPISLLFSRLEYYMDYYMGWAHIRARRH